MKKLMLVFMVCALAAVLCVGMAFAADGDNSAAQDDVMPISLDAEDGAPVADAPVEDADLAPDVDPEAAADGDIAEADPVADPSQVVGGDADTGVARSVLRLASFGIALIAVGVAALVYSNVKTKKKKK